MEMRKKKIEYSNILNPAIHLKKKKKKEDPNPEGNYVLQVLIHNAEGIDPPSKYPKVTRRNYLVMLWINPEDKYWTYEVEGFPVIEWNKQFDIPLKKFVTPESKFLSMEVIRVRSGCDPGTSNGVVVVGRVKVPLPEPGFKQRKRLGLVRYVDGAILGEGHISVTMKLFPVNGYW